MLFGHSPLIVFYMDKRVELMIPKTTKTPPTIAHMLIKNRAKGILDFVNIMETGEKSKFM